MKLKLWLTLFSIRHVGEHEWDVDVNAGLLAIGFLLLAFFS